MESQRCWVCGDPVPDDETSLGSVHGTRHMRCEGAPFPATPTAPAPEPPILEQLATDMARELGAPVNLHAIDDAGNVIGTVRAEPAAGPTGHAKHEGLKAAIGNVRDHGAIRLAALRAEKKRALQQEYGVVRCEHCGRTLLLDRDLHYSDPEEGVTFHQRCAFAAGIGVG